MEGISDILEILGWYNKMRGNQQWKTFSNSEWEEKILEKSLLEFKGRKERENIVRDPKTTTREYTWIQRVQTSQVLEAWGVI